MLDGWSKIDDKSFEPTVYMVHSVNDELTALFNRLGVNVVHLDHYGYESWDHSGRLIESKPSCKKTTPARHAGSALLYTCASASAWALAPTQIWWAMKYHSLSLDEIDGYFGLGTYEKFRNIDDRQWRIVHAAVLELFDPQQTALALQQRQKFEGCRKLLGCMG